MNETPRETPFPPPWMTKMPESLLRSLVRGEACPHDREDLVQSIWLIAVSRPPRYDGSLGAWFHTLARTSLVRRRLAETRRRDAERIWALDRRSVPAESVEEPALNLRRAEAAERVQECLDKLNPAQRRIVSLRYLEGLSLPDTAEKVGIPLETARSRLRRAVRLLRKGVSGGP